VNNRDVCNALYKHLRARDVHVDISDFKVAAIAQEQQARSLPTAASLVVINDFKAFLEGKRYSASTQETYMQFAIPFIIHFESKALSQVTGDDVRLYIQGAVKSKNYAISTHRQLVSALKLLLSLHKNSTDLTYIDRPKKSTFKPAVLNNSEVLRLLQCTVNLKHRCILAMIYSCGLRVGEAVSLKPHDVDLERMQLHVRNGKGRKDRYVGMASSLIPLLHNYLNSFKPGVYLFEGAQKGEMYSANSIRSFLRSSCKAAQIQKTVTPHTLRHSYATHLIENGTGIAHIQRLLGHSRPETTMLYAHIANTDLMKIENPLDVLVSKHKAFEKSNKNLHISREN
jgi:site-specific recombinase XerD